jgi:hypothetical protein
MIQLIADFYALYDQTFGFHKRREFLDYFSDCQLNYNPHGLCVLIDTVRGNKVSSLKHRNEREKQTHYNVS